MTDKKKDIDIQEILDALTGIGLKGVIIPPEATSDQIDAIIEKMRSDENTNN